MVDELIKLEKISNHDDMLFKRYDKLMQSI